MANWGKSKKRVVELESKISEMEKKTADLERKLNREEEFERWHANRTVSGGQFGFSSSSPKGWRRGSGPYEVKS